MNNYFIISNKLNHFYLENFHTFNIIYFILLNDYRRFFNKTTSNHWYQIIFKQNLYMVPACCSDTRFRTSWQLHVESIARLNWNIFQIIGKQKTCSCASTLCTTSHYAIFSQLLVKWRIVTFVATPLRGDSSFF